MLNDSDRVSPRAQVGPEPPYKSQQCYSTGIREASPFYSYQVLGSRNPNTPQSWAKVLICNRQITEYDKVLEMFKNVDFIYVQNLQCLNIKHKADTKWIQT